MQNINSNVIGELKQDARFPDWWKSEVIAIPFFDNKKLPIYFMDFEPEADPEFLKEADNALQSFFQMGIEDWQSVTSLVYKNCMDFLALVEDDEQDHALRNIKDSYKIWQFVFPSEIYVTRRPYQDQDIYLNVACQCEWEQEHGLQLVFRQGKRITRVSSQDGHLTEADAYDKPDVEDELLSQFNKKYYKPATNNRINQGLLERLVSLLRNIYLTYFKKRR